MSIEELVSVIPPPAKPLEVGSLAQWKKSESEWNVCWPPDYFDLCSTYGSGWFMGISIYNPFSPAYRALVDQDLQLYKSLKCSEGDIRIPFDIFPTRPGLFPCGAEENGGTLFWLVDNTLEQWCLVLMGSVFTWELKKLSLTSFLAQIFDKRISCIWWDHEWQEKEFGKVWFEPEPMILTSEE